MTTSSEPFSKQVYPGSPVEAEIDYGVAVYDLNYDPYHPVEVHNSALVGAETVEVLWVEFDDVTLVDFASEPTLRSLAGRRIIGAATRFAAIIDTKPPNLDERDIEALGDVKQAHEAGLIDLSAMLGANAANILDELVPQIGWPRRPSLD